MAEKFPTTLIKIEYYLVNLTTKGQDLKRFTMLGQKLRELREAKGLVQRQVAAELEVDTAYVSKIESDEKLISRNHIAKLSKLLNVQENELQKLWLAEKILKIVHEEDQKTQALRLVFKNLK